MIAPPRILAALTLLVLPAAAFGQDSTPPSDSWSLGIGAALIDSPYAGEGSRVRPFPLVSYEGERVFLSGISGGVHLYDSDRFTFDAILAARLYGFDISDLGRAELQANGVAPDLLSDRDDGLDAGVRATYRAGFGAIALEGLHDISDASDGYEISLDYRYTWQLGQTAVSANAGASWMSSDLAGYYFGILDEEVARGVAAFSPGSVVIPRIGMSLVRQLGSKWQLLGSVEYEFLPSELDESPLLEPDSEGTGRLVLGLSRRF
jgi:MipA family protein